MARVLGKSHSYKSVQISDFYPSFFLVESLKSRREDAISATSTQSGQRKAKSDVELKIVEK